MSPPSPQVLLSRMHTNTLIAAQEAVLEISRSREKGLLAVREEIVDALRYVDRVLVDAK